jgi:hypothetical protein
MKYGIIKDYYGNIKRCVSFKLIETITDYNKGQIFNEYTRFYGDESYVIYDDGNIELTHNEDDATVFFSDNEAQVAFLQIIDKIKSGEIKYDGIQVIEYDELHNRSSEVLQYPNHHYRDLIQPISMYKGESSAKYKAREKRSEHKQEIMYCNLINYIKINGWELTDEDINYINTLNYHQLEHLLMINRGRNNFILNRRSNRRQ